MTDEKKSDSHYQSLQMKIIDDEMRDIIMVSKDTRSAIWEMNEAFSGDNET